jgi:AraC-like DNA-binding protein
MLDDLNAIALLYHGDRSALSPAQMANRLQSFLLEVIRCSRRPALVSRRESLRPLLDLIQQQPQEIFRVSDLAARAHLSVPRFNILFKEETGVPPGEYVLRAKVEAARRRLEQGGRAVTDIAYDLGFSSSQYFATVFKRLEGISPRDVLRAAGHSAAAPPARPPRSARKKAGKLTDFSIAVGQGVETRLRPGRR